MSIRLDENGFFDVFYHRHHKIEIGIYGPKETPWNVAIECMDCCEVLVDFDNPQITGEDKK